MSLAMVGVFCIIPLPFCDASQRDTFLCSFTRKSVFRKMKCRIVKMYQVRKHLVVDLRKLNRITVVKNSN